MSHRHTSQTHQPTPLMVASGEKVDIPTTALVVRARRSQRSRWAALGLVALLASVCTVAFLHADSFNDNFLSAISLSHGVAKLCPQSDALYPESHAQLWKTLGRSFDGDAFLTRAVAWLGGAVRIPYVFTDVLGYTASFSETPMLNEARRHSMTWAPLVRTSGGRLSGRSTTTSFSHSPSRA
jgi:hypothetical protein